MHAMSSYLIRFLFFFVQPVVILGKPKEGDFFPGLLREGYFLLDDDGTIVRPSLTELQAEVSIRYMEVHGRDVPYE